MYGATLRAHYDGEQIVIDEPYDLEPDTDLIITVLPTNMVADEHYSWGLFSLRGLERAYDDDEVVYTLDMIKKPNPDYERK